MLESFNVCAKSYTLHGKTRVHIKEGVCEGVGVAPPRKLPLHAYLFLIFEGCHLLAGWPFGLLAGRSAAWRIDWLVDWLNACQAGWLASCLVDRLAGWSAGWLAGWLAGRLAGDLVGWLPGRLAGIGWLVGLSSKPAPGALNLPLKP